MNQYHLPVVFVVLVLRDAGVVHNVEQSRETHGHLNERSHSTVLGETVLVVPAPVSPDIKQSLFLKAKTNIDDDSTWTKPARKQWDCRTDGEQAKQAAGKPSPK